MGLLLYTHVVVRTPTTPTTLERVVRYPTEVGFRGSSEGIFTIGRSKIGGPDVFGGAIPSGFGGPNDDLSDFVKSGTITRGRDSNIGSMSMGTCEVVLNDPNGIYNPHNPESPLAGMLDVFRPFRIQGEHSMEMGEGMYETFLHPLFYGFVTSIEHDPSLGVKETRIRAADLFLWLSRVSPVIEEVTDVTTGEAIGLILDAADFESPPYPRRLDDGDTIPQFSADGSQSALALIEGLLEAERGTFYIAADGTAVYQDRHARAMMRDPMATFAELGILQPGVEFETVRNRATVQRTVGGEEQSEPQTYEDTISRDRYGPADFGTISTPYLETDEQAIGLAGYIVEQLSRPRRPIWTLNLSSIQGGMITHSLLMHELGDHVAVIEDATGVVGNYHIERIEHRFERFLHETPWALSERPRVIPFTIGVSKIGSGDVIAY